MKSLFMLLAVCASFFAQATNGDETISPAARKSFQQTFAGASEVSWTVSENGYKASFQVAGQYANAYYDAAGNLAVITRNISPVQLPVVLLSSIKSDYANKWVSELIEVSNEGGTHYYITLEDGTQKLTLKSNGSYGWLRFQKQDK
jgi:hypothetical protein